MMQPDACACAQKIKSEGEREEAIVYRCGREQNAYKQEVSGIYARFYDANVSCAAK